MAIKIITLPFDEKNGSFDEKAVNYFIENKIVKNIKSDIMSYGKPYLNFVIEYENDKKKEEPKKIEFSDRENEVLSKLKDWRFQKSKEKGFPTYLIAKNKQLEEMIIKKMSSLEELKIIYGFGEKRTKEYGHDILNILKELTQETRNE